MSTKPEHPDTAALRRYVDSLSTADDLDLLCHMAGWKEDHPKYRAIAIELQRRAKKRELRISWVAVSISVASLCVSIIGVIVRH